eukprot:352143-Chlamydomonas_euryale.AAC.4
MGFGGRPGGADPSRQVAPTATRARAVFQQRNTQPQNRESMQDGEGGGGEGAGARAPPRA